MSLTPDQHETLIDRILALFQSNEASITYGENPDQWVEDNLPEGTEAADVASCMPEVGERLGGPHQANLNTYTAHGAPVTHSVVNEISYTYNTVYQQNAFIYAEEGAQVTNIQGDGNSVDQTQIDDSFNVDLPTDQPTDDGDDEPVEEPVAQDGYEDPDVLDDVEDGHDGYDDDHEGYEEPAEEPWTDPTMTDPGMDDGAMDPGGMDTGMDDGGAYEPAYEPPAEPADDPADVAEML